MTNHCLQWAHKCRLWISYFGKKKVCCLQCKEIQNSENWHQLGLFLVLFQDVLFLMSISKESMHELQSFTHVNTNLHVFKSTEVHVQIYTKNAIVFFFLRWNAVYLFYDALFFLVFSIVFCFLLILFRYIWIWQNIMNWVVFLQRRTIMIRMQHFFIWNNLQCVAMWKLLMSWLKYTCSCPMMY